MAGGITRIRIDHAKEGVKMSQFSTMALLHGASGQAAPQDKTVAEVKTELASAAVSASTAAPATATAKAAPAVKAKAKTAGIKVAKKKKPKAEDSGTTVSSTVQGKQTVIEPDVIATTAHEVENIGKENAPAIVRALLNDTDFNFFKLGGVLAVIQTNQWFGEHDTFRAYVEAEFGLSYRKAVYLVAIYTALVQSGVSWDKVKALGWTKLKELAGILTSKNADAWVKKALGATTLQLQDMVKQAREKQAQKEAADGASGDGATPETTAKKVSTKTFKLHDDQREIVEAALDKAKIEGNTEVDAVALEYICVNYVNNMGAVVAAKQKGLQELMAETPIEYVLATLEAVFPKLNMTIEMPEDGDA
jgi:hypothetical protein